ncbi:MAG: hypothetical protein ABSD78_16945 [Acidimicrobiales bacterium]
MRRGILVKITLVLTVGTTAWIGAAMTSDGGTSPRYVPCITRGLTSGQHPGECLVGAGAVTTTTNPWMTGTTMPRPMTTTTTTGIAQP